MFSAFLLFGAKSGPKFLVTKTRALARATQAAHKATIRASKAMTLEVPSVVTPVDPIFGLRVGHKYRGWFLCPVMFHITQLLGIFHFQERCVLVM